MSIINGNGMHSCDYLTFKLILVNCTNATFAITEILFVPTIHCFAEKNCRIAMLNFLAFILIRNIKKIC